MPYLLQPHGQTLRILCWVKQASQRKTSTIWFHLDVESNEQNKLTNRIERYRDTESRGDSEDGWKKVKGLSEETMTHRHKQQYGDYQKERSVAEVGEGKGGINGDARTLDSGRWAHNTTYRWYIIESYTWNLSNFINQCHHNHSHRNKNKNGGGKKIT